MYEQYFIVSDKSCEFSAFFSLCTHFCRISCMSCLRLY